MVMNDFWRRGDIAMSLCLRPLVRTRARDVTRMMIQNYPFNVQLLA